MTTTLTDLAPSAIKPNKLNPRNAIGDVAELAASIRSHGILEPLIVAPGAKAGEYVLIAGHRRLAAATEAKLKTLPCLVREDLKTPAQQLEAMLIENTQRSDLSPTEEGRAYQQLLEFPGYTQAKISKTTGRDKKTIRGRIALTKLPAATTKKIDAGAITLHDAEQLLQFLDDRTLYNRVANAIGTSNYAWTVSSAKRELTTKTKNKKRINELKAAGHKVTAAPHGAKRPAAAEQVTYLTNTETGTKLFPKPDEHASCKHHVYWLDYNGTPVAYCTKPSSHPETKTKPGAKKAAGAAARKESPADTARREKREALQIATDVRREWIRDNLAGPKVAPNAEQLAQMLRRAALDGLAICNTHDVPILGRETVEELVDEVNAGANTTRLIQIIFVTHCWVGTAMLDDYSWKDEDRRNAYDVLVHLGYTPSDVENTAYAAGAPAQAEDNS